MRLIDADELGIGKANPDIFKEKAYAHGWNSAVEIIESAPTVDAVPVVRCRECKYSTNAKWNKKGYRICPASHMEITDDDFCSYGERMEADNGQKESEA